MSKIKIRFENVYKIFGSNPEKALKAHKKGLSKDEILEKTGNAIGVADVSFDVYEGETLVIMGLSGSGKSTLLRCINRLMEPTFGKVYMDDVDITTLNQNELRDLRREKFGMVFQQFALLPHKTVLDNAAFGLEIQNTDKNIRHEKAAKALELVGLKGWENYYPSQLSGGMLQRVGLARALAIDPDILLMDEAFSALDPLIRTEMQDELLSLESTVQKTIIFITHDLDEALKIGDRIVLMKDGEVIQIGTPDEILKSPTNKFVKKFVENVDVTKILTAKDAMIEPKAVSFLKDGPITALHNMKQGGTDGCFLLKRNHELVGYVTAENAAKAAKREETSLESVTEVFVKHKVNLDVPIKDLFKIMVDSRYPIAVVDDNNKLCGKIIDSSVMATLAERGEY